jgi:hypothetical protein
MNFSAILDISSFFIGMIINLLLIALICYYFKRKYENLEIAQNEQAKVLYQLLQQNSNIQPKVININELLKKDTDTRNEVKSFESHYVPSDESDSDDSDTDSESDSEEVEEVVSNQMNEIKTINLSDTINDIEEINVNLDIEKIDDNDKTDAEKNDYSKMTIKQLKDALSVKGINANKMKKNEMIELIEKTIVEKSPLSIDE